MDKAFQYKDSYVLTFVFGNNGAAAMTTIRVSYNDSCGADLVIVEMATIPCARRRQGYGRSALTYLMRAARKRGIGVIRAVQVQTESERFWRKQGFRSLENHTNDFERAL